MTDLITRLERADRWDRDWLTKSLADAPKRFAELPVAIRSRVKRPALRAQEKDTNA